MAELTLVRHAQASFGTEDPVAYDALSELGFQQARWLGEHLTDLGQRFDLVVTGDLRRHRQTLEGIRAGAASPAWPEAEVMAGLNEHPFHLLLSAYRDFRPDDPLVAAWQASPGERRAFFRLLKQALKAWQAGAMSADYLQPWSDYIGAIEAVLAQLQRRAAHTERILAISSGGTIACAVGLVLDLSPEKMVELNLQARNTGVTRLVVTPRAVRLVEYNAIAHLERGDRRQAVTYA